MYIILVNKKYVDVYCEHENGDLLFIEHHTIDEIDVYGLQEYYGAKLYTTQNPD